MLEARRMKHALTLLVALVAACGGDGDGDGDGGGGADAAVQGSCFYSCTTQLGTSYGCTTRPEIKTETECDADAESRCGGANLLLMSEFAATCVGCSDNCAPSWHKP